jgi:endonuclease YncB( thermonuclease family)
MRKHLKMSSRAEPDLRQRAGGGLGRAHGRGSAGQPIRFQAWAGWRLVIFFFAAAVALARPAGGQAGAGLCPDAGGARGRVASVNERFELILEGGIRLKIAGVDPPRPTPGDPELDVRARERLAQWLVGQEILFLPLEQGLDRWGRMAAFVFAAAPEQANEPEKASLPVGAALIDAGLARYEPSAAARPCRASLLAAEAGARAAGLGLWADPYYAVIAAADRPSFAEKAGTAVIVEGRIIGIADRRPRIMLFFGPRQGWDFSVTLYSRNNKAFEAAYASLAGLTGRTVRVRGLLDTRFGPQIEISNPDEIEVTGQEQDAQAAPPGPPAPR